MQPFTMTDLCARSELAPDSEQVTCLAFPQLDLYASNGEPLLGLEEVGPVLERCRASGALGSVISGAVPFDIRARPQLLLHRSVTRGEAARAQMAPTSERSRSSAAGDLGTGEILRTPTRSSYQAAVQSALKAIEDGELTKVVLARSVDLRVAKPVDLVRLVAALRAHNPGKYVFRVPLGGSLCLAGASPELLLSKDGDRVVSEPLAGSSPRAEDPAEDAERAAALQASAKDRFEHARVVEAVASALRPHCDELVVPAAPRLVSTSALWHLATRISGRLRDARTHSLDLALALHPTPAVCGEPRSEAARTLRELEGFDREFYGGLVGYCDARGNGQWSIALRCARISGRSLRLYAGAGIVRGSSPQAELEESTAKFRTMLSALGLEHLQQVV